MIIIASLKRFGFLGIPSHLKLHPANEIANNAVIFEFKTVILRLNTTNAVEILWASDSSGPYL